MSMSKTLIGILCCAIIVLTTGCQNQQLNDLKAQNRIQQGRISELEANLAECDGNLKQKTQELADITGKFGAGADAKDATIAALEADIAKKKALIEKMQSQLLEGGQPLPPEMNVLLQEFAKTSDMIDFDATSGMLKFKSDLLFDSGSDNVQAGAAESIKALADIMNSEEGKQFDIVIVGHPDDMPIKKAETLRNHPSNWHLSVHRAISVEKILEGNGISAQRLAVKGYGEYRPVEPNKPDKKGNPVNRRVEIFIIPGSS